MNTRCPAASPRSHSCGCCATTTPISRSLKFETCCCAQSRGPANTRSMSWWITSRRQHHAGRDSACGVFSTPPLKQSGGIIRKVSVKPGMRVLGGVSLAVFVALYHHSAYAQEADSKEELSVVVVDGSRR